MPLEPPPSPKAYHHMGKRDACAEILLTVRNRGERNALRMVAQQLLAVDPNHPHAAWYLENHPEAGGRDE